MDLQHYQAGFKPLLFGIALALVLICFLKETGPAARRSQEMKPAKERADQKV
jgi:hypothetical protein